MVSSVTPRTDLAMVVHLFLSVSNRSRSRFRKTLYSAESFSSAGAPRRPSRTAPAQHQHGGVAAVVENHVRGFARPGEHLLGGPPVLLEGLALPGEDRSALGSSGVPVRADDHGGRRVILVGRCCSSPTELQHRGATSVSMRTAVWTVMCSEPEIRAPLSGNTSAYSRRSAIRPGISCSASPDLFAAELGLSQVGNLVVDAVARVSSKRHGVHAIGRWSAQFGDPVSLGERCQQTSRSSATS